MSKIDDPYIKCPSACVTMRSLADGKRREGTFSNLLTTCVRYIIYIDNNRYKYNININK